MVRWFWAAALAATWVLAGCGSSPTISHQKSFDVQAAKVERVLFFYRNEQLRTVDSYQTGSVRISVSPGETGLDRFGDALVKRTPEVLARHGVSVVHASVASPGDWARHSTKSIAEYGVGRMPGATLMVVRPVGGSARANLHASRVSMVFEVRVIDAKAGKVAWIGHIDTSTFKGRDFIARQIQGRELDEAYADEFVALIVESLKGAGLM